VVFYCHALDGKVPSLEVFTYEYLGLL
jgi:hypothetical protein